MKVYKINHFESGCVTVRVHRTNNKACNTQFRQNFINMVLPVYLCNT